MTTITHSTGTITPEVVDGYQASRDLRTVVHDVINRSNPDVTLRAPGLRGGSLQLVFASESDAQNAFAAMSIPQVLTLTDPDRPSIGMSFVAAGGDLAIGLDEETRDVWVVTVPFVEVAP